MSRKIASMAGNEFSERLSVLMAERGTTQAVLAAYLGIKRQTVSLYQSGQSDPNWKQVVAMAKYFNTTTDYLVGLSDCRSIETDLRAVCDYTGLSEKAVKAIRVNAEYLKSGSFDNMELNFGDFVPPEIINFMIENESKLTLFQTFEQYIRANPINQTMLANANGRIENATDNPAIGIEMSEELENTQPDGYFYIFNSSHIIERLMIDDIEKALKKAREIWLAQNNEVQNG